MPRRNLVWILAIVTISLICWQPAQSATEDENYALFRTFVDTLEQVERNYVKPVDRRELFEGALRGIMETLDPYSNYISEEELQQFTTHVEQKFGGIGIQISLDEDTRQLTVMSPLVGTPAYNAGVLAGDKIIAIEGESTKGITLEDAVKKLKGDPDTKVTITVLHETKEGMLIEPEEITITRAIIHIETVLGDTRKEDASWDFMLDKENKIGYVRLMAFSKETAGELRKAIEELQGQEMKGLILDLRSNPGGLLTSAIEISDMFVSEGTIVSTEGRNHEARTWTANRRGTLEDFPMVVLVNQFSASASEIVSACLQDHNRAVIVGERTWGKGSVQNVIQLEGGRSALKLTTASYQRPSGKNIHRFKDAKEEDEWGVMPNEGYLVKYDVDELRNYFKNRRDRDVVRNGDAAPQNGEEPDAKFIDRQMSKALEYLTGQLAKAN